MITVYLILMIAYMEIHDNHNQILMIAYMEIHDFIDEGSWLPIWKFMSFNNSGFLFYKQSF